MPSFERQYAIILLDIKIFFLYSTHLNYPYLCRLLLFYYTQQMRVCVQVVLPKWDALGYTNRYQSIVCVVLTVNKIIKTIKLLLSPGFSNSETTTTGTHSQLGCLSNPVVTPYKWGTIHSLVDLCVPPACLNLNLLYFINSNF